MSKPLPNELTLISQKEVKAFLDGVDLVLNSNTFLLEFEIFSADLVQSLNLFLKLGDFVQQLIKQDIVRGWYNLHYFDNIENNYKVRPGKLLKDNFNLKISRPTCDKREYLTAMLTGDTSKGSFFSFYGKQMQRTEAEILIDELTSYLSADENWDLYILDPNFLENADDNYQNSLDLKYFEGSNANDSATVITIKQKGFLILTNGID